MSRPRLSVSALMLAIAAIAGMLAAYQGGRRAQLAALGPPPVSVWITPRGTHYHRADCRYAARGAEVRLDRLGPRYAPCAYCRPPAAPSAALTAERTRASAAGGTGPTSSE